MIKEWKIRKSGFFLSIVYIAFLFYKIIATSTFGKVVGANVIIYIKFFQGYYLL